MNQTFKFSALAIAAALALTACDKKDANKPAAASAPASASAASGASAATDTSSIGTPTQQASYAMGMDVGKSLKQMKEQGFEVDMKAFFNAVQSVYDGKQTKLSESEASIAQVEIMTELEAKATKKYEEEAQANKEKGEAFLKENAIKEGVKTTASGLQYKMIKEGTGRQPRKNDLVHIGYEGRLIDGTVFDSSKDGASDDGVGEYSIVPVGQIIKGLGEGLKILKEGGEATFYIPAKLAYGEEKVGNKIGPNSVLIFDVKLVKIDRNGKYRIR